MNPFDPLDGKPLLPPKANASYSFEIGGYNNCISFLTRISEKDFYTYDSVEHKFSTGKKAIKRFKFYLQERLMCSACQEVATKTVVWKTENGIYPEFYTNNMSPLTLDHIVPKAQGGSNQSRNLQVMCQECNEEKGSSYSGYASPQQVKPPQSRVVQAVNRKKLIGGINLALKQEYPLYEKMGTPLTMPIQYLEQFVAPRRVSKQEVETLAELYRGIGWKVEVSTNLAMEFDNSLSLAQIKELDPLTHPGGDRNE